MVCACASHKYWVWWWVFSIVVVVVVVVGGVRCGVAVSVGFDSIRLVR